MIRGDASARTALISSVLFMLICGTRFRAATTEHSVVSADSLNRAPNPWTQKIDSAPLHRDSESMIAWLSSNGGFGTGELRVDFSIALLEADSSATSRPVVQSPEYYQPDCDVGLEIPLPQGGAIEGSEGYQCNESDCHLLVFDSDTGTLYESFSTNVTPEGIESLCAVKWDLNQSYPPELRGDQCTSADAAGLPIAPLLFSADEISAGEIAHAIRFILPNPRIRKGEYVRPATHAGAPSGPPEAIPYGATLRLRADYPLDGLSAAAQVVAKALQTYGMILADGGEIALTARDDRFTASKWSDVGFDSDSLASLEVSDFEVVDTGPSIPHTNECVRETTIVDSHEFID